MQCRYRHRLWPHRFYLLEHYESLRTFVVEEQRKSNNPKNDKNMKKYVCTVCNWVYDPAVGDPDSGIAPGTPFEAIPDDWACPLSGVTKEDFALVEE